ncbi:MAG: metal-dependent transcriptional regulator [Candidatus Anstonellaceae archaeon]
MESTSAEEYARAFYYLQKKNGIARVSELARYLGVSKAGVSEMLSFMSKKGLMKTKRYAPASLTSAGLRLAKKMTFRHRVLEYFLSEKLGMPANRIHAEASRLEHAISDDAVERIYSMMGKPKYDPHGSPIVR